MDCYISGNEYTTWEGLFYRKRKVHNCTNVRSSRYGYEIKNAGQLAEGKALQYMFYDKHFRKETMEDHNRKKSNFTLIKCKLGCSKRRKEMFKDHINWHNIYSKNEYCMKPEKLEDLLNPEHYDIILVTEELAEKQIVKYSSRWILDLVYLKGAHFQEIVLGLDDGHIGMCCTLTGINKAIICKSFM